MKATDTQDEATTEGMAEAAGQQAKCCVDAGVNAIHAVSDKARQITRGADGYVRDNPWIAIGVAAGLGIAAGLLLRGRRRS